jgi:FkbM family methyltransferase
VRVRTLGPRSWLVQRGADERPATLRATDLGTHADPAWVLARPRSARQRAATHQLQIGRYQQAHHLAWLLRDLKINCVLDVGANRGQFASRLRAGGYRGRIVSFEPVGHVFADLERAAAGDPEWVVHRLALGEEDASSEIHVDERALSSLLPASEFGREWKPRMGTATTETILVRRLEDVWDDAVRGLPQPRVLLKLDTQGFDVPAFRGAGDRIPDIAAVQTEVSVTPIYDGMAPMAEHLAVFVDAGFTLSGMTPVSYAFGSLQAIEFDAVLVRPEQAPHHTQAPRA